MKDKNGVTIKDGDSVRCFPANEVRRIGFHIDSPWMEGLYIFMESHHNWKLTEARAAKMEVLEGEA